MTIARVKPFNWITHEILTSAQINQLDTNVTYALDKRAGQTDDLASVITVRSTGALNCISGATVSFASGSILTVDSGTVVTIAMNAASSQSFAAGSTLTVGGIYSFGAASVGTIDNTLHLSGTATLTADINSNIALNGILTASNLSVSTFNGAVTFGGTTTVAASSLTWNYSGNVTFGCTTNITNGATGQSFNIVGQNCSGTTSTGGDIVLNTGTGTSVNGTLRFKAGGTSMMAMNQNSIAVYKPTTAIGASIVSGAQLISYSATTNVDYSLGNTAVVTTLTGNVTVNATNVVDGGIYTLWLQQDATGGRLFGMTGAVYQLGNLGTYSTVANKINVFTFVGRVIAGVQYLYATNITTF